MERRSPDPEPPPESKLPQDPIPLLPEEDTGCCAGHLVIVSEGSPESGQLPRVRLRNREFEVCSRSLYVFPLRSCVRRRVIELVTWWAFDKFILFLIFFNSICLASYDHRSESDSGFNWVSDNIFDPILTSFFTLEFILKVIAFGFVVDKTSYLRDAWNWLDFIVVVTGVLQMTNAITSQEGVGFLRMFRILRPLRSLNAVPQMKVLVNTVLSSIPRLGNVSIMAAFLFVSFGIVGVSLFGGVFHRGCHTIPKPVLVGSNGTECWSWPFTGEERLCGGRYLCEDGPGGSTGFCGGHEQDTDKALRRGLDRLEDSLFFPVLGKGKRGGRGGKGRGRKGKWRDDDDGKKGHKGKGKGTTPPKTEDPFGESPEDGEPTTEDMASDAGKKKGRRRRRSDKDEGGALKKMKDEQETTPAKRVQKAEDQHAPMPPSRISTVPELQKLCAGLTSERMTQYVHLPQYGKDMLAAERVLGTFECSQKYRPGMLNPTLDQINRFETALEAAFALGGNGVSLLSDGVSEFSGVKYAGLPENFIPCTINLPAAGFDPIAQNPLNNLVTCNRPSSLAIHERDLLLTDIHVLFICKVKQVPWAQAVKAMLRMRNIPSSPQRREYFSFLAEIYNVVPSANAAATLRQMDTRTGSWTAWLTRCQAPDYFQLGLFQEPSVDLIRDKLVSDRTLTGFSTFPLKDARTSFDSSTLISLRYDAATYDRMLDAGSVVTFHADRSFLTPMSAAAMYSLARLEYNDASCTAANDLPNLLTARDGFLLSNSDFLEYRAVTTSRWLRAVKRYNRMSATAICERRFDALGIQTMRFTALPGTVDDDE
ncbi:CACNA1D [Symbiodinium sp. CCMP2592]|nr:CACNA1D [Symbiodinium sp. CCMP2592]